VGNRTQSVINGVTTAYNYDINDRLTQQGGTTYVYDANVYIATVVNPNSETFQMAYDAKSPRPPS
jgi:hypothetical protein